MNIIDNTYPTIEYIFPIIPAKAHSQEVEHWVNRIGNNAACGRSEAASSAMAVGQSHDHQLVTIRHQEDLRH